MMKRLLKSLFVGAFLAAGVNAFAIAPTIADLPEVSIGDNEDNISTDNNFFVFTNAFAFDTYVSDPDSTVSSLIWSFDEGNPTGPNWFTINGLPPVAVGDAAIAAEEVAGGVNRINPGPGFNIRSGNVFATFRDVIFSPPPTVLPYPDPVNPDKAAHQAGKVVRFYVSDGTQVASQDTLVKTVDDTFDALSPSCTFSTAQTDSFTTDVSTVNPVNPGWFFDSAGTAATGAYNAGAQSLAITVTANAANTYKIGTWQTTLPDWLPYSFVGNQRAVRGKFYVYASGTTPATANNIPLLRVKLTNTVAVASTLEVLHTNNNADDTLTRDFAPSFTAGAPSLYRVDLDPVDVPALSLPSGIGGTGRTFECYHTTPQGNGTLHLAESSIGTYSINSCTPLTVLPSKTYNPGDFANFDGTAYDGFRLIGGGAGVFGTSDRTAGQVPTVTHSGVTGLTLSSVGMPSANLGVATADPTPFGKVAGSVVPADWAALLRWEQGKQYSVRWHITSTQQTNRQSQMRLRTRSVGFGWSQKLEIGGAYPSNNAEVQAVAQQTLPGVGTGNPEKIGTENGGWYNLIFHSPLDPDIRADVAGPIATKMPNLSALPPPGSTTANLRSAVLIGLDLVDTISPGVNKNLEEGLFTIDQVQIRVHNKVAD